MRITLQVLILLAFSAACHNDLPVDEQDASENDDRHSPKEEEIVENSAARTILFFGNSITAGYGLEPGESFPSLIQQRLDSLQYDYKVIGSGVNGETTRQGLKRIEKVMNEFTPDILVVELGINDAIQGIPTEETYENLGGIVDKAREANPSIQIILAGIDPVVDEQNLYSPEFRRIYPRLARAKEVDLIPQLMGEVLSHDSLTFDDNLHPNQEGVKIVTDNVWYVLEAHLEKGISGENL